MQKTLRRTSGFSLVELMVAMVAGLILVAAVTSLFVFALRANSTAMKVSRLNQEIQSAADMIASDIQRAGYDGKAASRLVSGTSPFYFDVDSDLMKSEVSAGIKTYHCIRVRYDANDNGQLDNDDNETHVYSHGINNGVNGIILGTDPSAACDTGSALSSNDASTLDDIIEITELNFELLPGSQASGARAINLSIKGQYRDKNPNNPILSLELQQDIKLRNDGYEN